MAMTETQTRRDPFRTIVARHPGKCKRCGGAIIPGDTIRWAKGRGRTYHMADRCPARAVVEAGETLAGYGDEDDE